MDLDFLMKNVDAMKSRLLQSPIVILGSPQVRTSCWLQRESRGKKVQCLGNEPQAFATWWEGCNAHAASFYERAWWKSSSAFMGSPRSQFWSAEDAWLQPQATLSLALSISNDSMESRASHLTSLHLSFLIYKIEIIKLNFWSCYGD